MIKSNIKLQNTVKILLSVIIIGLLAFLAANENLKEKNLWYDESGQFWMAKGLDHFSQPNSLNGTFMDSINSNAKMNLDPGGFTLILRYWSKISNNTLWLRILPFLFFLGLLATFFFLGNNLGGFKLGLFSSLLAFLSSLIFSYAFEIRAYEMEAFCTALLLLLILQINQSLTIKKLLILSLVISIGITSRYSEFIIALSTAIFALWKILKKNISLKNKIVMVLALTILPLIVFLSIFEYSLIPQIHNILHGVKGPQYSFDFSSNINYEKIITLLPSFLAVTIYFVFMKSFENKNIGSIIFIIIFSNIVFFCLSIVGIHPYSPWSKWCISLGVVNSIAFIVVIFEFRNISKYINSINNENSIKKLNTKLLSIIVFIYLICISSLFFLNISFNKSIILIILFSIIFLLLIIGYKKKFFLNTRKTIIKIAFGFIMTSTVVLIIFGIKNHSLPLVGSLDYPSKFDRTYYALKSLDLNKMKKIYISQAASPTVRYLFEYGSLSENKNGYPEKFYFDSKNLMELNKIEVIADYDLLIFSLLPKKFADEDLKLRNLKVVDENPNILIKN